MPSLKNILFGKKDKIKQKSTQTPLQQELMRLIQEGLTSGEGAFGDIFGAFDEEEFNKGVKEPALKNFQDEILPMLQEKFIAGNQVGGSGQQGAQLKAGTDLQAKLAELMYNAQNQQKQNKVAGLQTALNAPGFQNIYKQGSTGVIPGAAQGLLKKGGEAAGAYIAG